MKPTAITRTEFINRFSERAEVSPKVGQAIVKQILSSLAESLSEHRRIEIRRFGSFEPKTRAPRIGRNPRTGENVQVTETRSVLFKAGKELRERVSEAR